MIGERVLPPAVGSPLRSIMFGDQPRAFVRVAARGGGGRPDDHLDLAAAGHAKHAETEPPAQIAVARVALAALAARRHFGCEPHLVAGAGAVDRLQQQFEVEGKL